MLKPGLVIKAGTFSAGKTSNSIGDAKSFNPFKQINVTNQPSGYSHIIIKTPKDLINLIWDIFYYNLYFCGYEEKMEQLELYKKTKYNFENHEYGDLFPKALNMIKTHNFLKDLWTRFKLNLGVELSCVLMGKQLENEIHFIENNYLVKRKKFTDIYGEDLLLNIFTYISLDEAPLYFGARNFEKNFSGENKKLLDFIVYPVKLNTRIETITQNPNLLDINFRRQASNYKLHKGILGGLIKKTQEVEVKDPEKVRFDDCDIVSKRISPNFYQIFGYPRVQYYRKHIISPLDDDVYSPGMFFEYLQFITQIKNTGKITLPSIPDIITEKPTLNFNF